MGKEPRRAQGLPFACCYVGFYMAIGLFLCFSWCGDFKQSVCVSNGVADTADTAPTQIDYVLNQALVVVCDGDLEC